MVLKPSDDGHFLSGDYLTFDLSVVRLQRIIRDRLITGHRRDVCVREIIGHSNWLAVAQLAVPVVAPRPKCAVARQRETEISAGRNGDGLAQSAHRRGARAIRIHSVAELAVFITAPRPHCAVRLQRNVVRETGGQRDHIAQPENRRWTSDGRTNAVPELSGVVASPTPHRAVRLQSQTVPPPPGHGARIRQPSGGNPLATIPLLVVSPPAEIIPAPRPDAPRP